MKKMHRIIFVAFIVLTLLSGCKMHTTAQELTTVEGMKFVECISSDDTISPIKVSFQVPEEWNVKVYDLLDDAPPATAIYALYVKNSNDSSWINAGEVTIYGYSEDMKMLDSQTLESYLSTVDMTKRYVEETPDINIAELEETEYNEYPAFYVDYVIGEDLNDRQKEVFISNNEQNESYFSVDLILHMQYMDQETSQKIIDSLKVEDTK